MLVAGDRNPVVDVLDLFRTAVVKHDGHRTSHSDVVDVDGASGLLDVVNDGFLHAAIHAVQDTSEIGDRRHCGQMFEEKKIPTGAGVSL